MALDVDLLKAHELELLTFFMIFCGHFEPWQNMSFKLVMTASFVKLSLELAEVMARIDLQRLSINLSALQNDESKCVKITIFSFNK